MNFKIDEFFGCKFFFLNLVLDFCNVEQIVHLLQQRMRAMVTRMLVLKLLLTNKRWKKMTSSNCFFIMIIKIRRLITRF